MIRSFNGKTPKIAESAFISEAACIIGDVEIGDNSGVWPGAVIRGDFGSIKIGCNSNIEDNSVLHGAGIEIGDNVIIGHSVVMEGKKIGNNTVIGNNATILVEAEIGNFCIIGAGCLVRQGMKIPDNSFVAGVPGEIKGKASSKEQLFWIEEAPRAYAKLVKQYKEQGF